MLNKIVKVVVDRPIGSIHPNYKETYYSINYGYIEGTLALDDEEIDAYILGVDIPIKYFTGKVIAIIHREDDMEIKCVVAPINMEFTLKEIEDKVHFIEKYFKSTVIMSEK